jgi:hypothetical protein
MFSVIENDFPCFDNVREKGTVKVGSRSGNLKCQWLGNSLVIILPL